VDSEPSHGAICRATAYVASEAEALTGLKPRMQALFGLWLADQLGADPSERWRDHADLVAEQIEARAARDDWEPARYGSRLLSLSDRILAENCLAVGPLTDFTRSLVEVARSNPSMFRAERFLLKQPSLGDNGAEASEEAIDLPAQDSPSLSPRHRS
jgi:hypothetical protein